MEPDAPVLRPRSQPLRVAAFVLVAAGVVAWDAVAPHIDPVSTWWAVAIIAAGALPATLALVYLALPLWSRPRIVAAGLVVFLAAARKSAKKRMSGGPSPAARPPGATNATATAE